MFFRFFGGKNWKNVRDNFHPYRRKIRGGRVDDIFPKLKREIIKIFPYRATLSRPGRIFSLLLLVGKTKLSKCSIKNGIALRSSPTRGGNIFVGSLDDEHRPTRWQQHRFKVTNDRSISQSYVDEDAARYGGRSGPRLNISCQCSVCECTGDASDRSRDHSSHNHVDLCPLENESKDHW